MCQGNFFAGFQTTSRCEGVNSEFGKYVNLRDHLLEFVRHFFRWLNYMRFREVEADFTSSFGEPVLQSQLYPLEKSASKIYTREIFNLLVPVFKRACTCSVIDIKQSGSKFNYNVVRYGKKDVEWHVSFCDSKLEFMCSCMRLESLGIPCEHLFAVFVWLEIVNFPDTVILQRLTNSAKDSISGLEGKIVNPSDPALVSAYLWIVESSKRMANATVKCGKPEYIRTTMDIISKHTSSLEAICNGEQTEQPFNEAYVEGTLKNPNRARSKGCGGAPSSQNKGKTPRKVQSCGACGRKGHNRKSCPIPTGLEKDNVAFEGMVVDEGCSNIETVLLNQI